MADTADRCRDAETLQQGLEILHDGVRRFSDLYEEVWRCYRDFKGSRIEIAARHTLLVSQMAECLSPLIARTVRNAPEDLDLFLAENVLRCGSGGAVSFESFLKIVDALIRAEEEARRERESCSETQKFGHVTYFWNGNRSEKFSDELETWEEIPSDIIPFERKPWMKAAEITDHMIRSEDPDAYLDDAETRKKKAEQRKKDADYQVIDEVPYWSNGSGFVSGTRSALFLVEVETSGELKVRRLTAPAFQLEEMTAEGTDIYYAGIAWSGKLSLDAKVYVYHEYCIPAGCTADSACR